jgi:protein-S-isoprenylcysteine O-methyltransferase Ste14
MSRFLTLIYGALVYLFFLVTFLYTIGFVSGVPGLKTVDSGVAGDPWIALAVDVALLGLFAVQHSVMARRSFKQRWTRIVPPPLERSTFVLAASLAVALLIWQWRPLPEMVWAFDGRAAEALLIAVSGLGWAMLLVATFLINHFELFGLQQVFENWRGRHFEPPAFRTPALYRIVRHPIYLGFILAFWATPRMSHGHLLFALATTGYIFIGDLVARFGGEYRRYRRQVPMLLPWIRLGQTAGAEHRPPSPAE